MKSIVLKIVQLIVFLVLPCFVMAQKLSEHDKLLFAQEMIEHYKQIQTLQCDFVQEKTSAMFSQKAVAKGVMLHQPPSMLHWEYTMPTPSTLILNGGSAALFNKDGKRIGSEAMMKQLGALIISMVNGDGIKNTNLFASECYDVDDKEMLLVLTPMHKRMKEFKSIELTIEKNTFLASRITLNEKSGDQTTIYLNNKLLNQKISMDKFAIK
jgi:outer membrane lipoprotein-sorting protein